MQSKGISVIMTTFNGAAFIRQQLDSILSQTHQAEEIIICDDGFNRRYHFNFKELC